MTREDLIGTWKCTRSIRNGQEKIHKNPITSITFNADGTGTFKLTIIPLHFEWSYNNGMLTMMNTSTGEPVSNNLELMDDCIAMEAENSASYFYKD